MYIQRAIVRESKKKNKKIKQQKNTRFHKYKSVVSEICWVV